MSFAILKHSVATPADLKAKEERNISSYQYISVPVSASLARMLHK